MTKTIAIFVKNLTSGGAEKQAVLLAKSMTHDCKVHFIVFNGYRVHEKYLNMMDGTEVRVKMFYGSHWNRFTAFVKYLKEEKVDIIFSYLAAADMYASIAGRIVGCKIFTSLRNSDISKGRQIAGRLMTNVLATGTISNCYSGKDTVVGYGFNAEKIHVIPNCFETIQPYTAKPNREVVDVITVGRFVAQKDYEVAIKSIAEVRKMGAKVHFTIVGWGKMEADIRQWVKQYDIEHNCNIYINPNNIPELLDNADIYVSTSWKEGTSNSIMEGLNANLPVVATDAGDNKYLVKDGHNGYICPIGDVRCIANRIYRLAMDKALREKFGAKGKEHLKTEYSMEVFRKHYMDIINKC